MMIYYVKFLTYLIDLISENQKTDVFCAIFFKFCRNIGQLFVNVRHIMSLLINIL